MILSFNAVLSRRSALIPDLNDEFTFILSANLAVVANFDSLCPLLSRCWHLSCTMHFSSKQSYKLCAMGPKRPISNSLREAADSEKLGFVFVCLAILDVPRCWD